MIFVRVKTADEIRHRLSVVSLFRYLVLGQVNRQSANGIGQGRTKGCPLYMWHI